MRIIKLTPEVEKSLAMIIDAALKNIKLGGLLIKPQVYFLESSIVEEQEKTKDA